MATILLVEDDTSMRLLTTAKLKHRYAIISVQDGVEALDVLERQPVDLIIADVMMPRMDGYTLVKTLRERGDQIPVLLLTAKQSFEDKREGFSSGVDSISFCLIRDRSSPETSCWTGSGAMTRRVGRIP